MRVFAALISDHHQFQIKQGWDMGEGQYTALFLALFIRIQPSVIVMCSVKKDNYTTDEL